METGGRSSISFHSELFLLFVSLDWFSMNTRVWFSFEVKHFQPCHENHLFHHYSQKNRWIDVVDYVNIVEKTFLQDLLSPWQLAYIPVVPVDQLRSINSISSDVSRTLRKMKLKHLEVALSSIAWEFPGWQEWNSSNKQLFRYGLDQYTFWNRGQCRY